MDLIKLNLKYDSSVKELDDILPGTAKKVQELSEKKLKEITKYALQAIQTKVPRATDQLRNSQIKKEFSGSTSRIYVTDTVHTNTVGKRKPKASELALLLDEGVDNGVILHRRKSALSANSLFSAPSKGSLTAGWIEQAQSDFKANLGGFLNGK